MSTNGLQMNEMGEVDLLLFDSKGRLQGKKFLGHITCPCPYSKFQDEWDTLLEEWKIWIN